jgi:hypothetical protein
LEILRKNRAAVKTLLEPVLTGSLKQD